MNELLENLKSDWAVLQNETTVILGVALFAFVFVVGLIFAISQYRVKRVSNEIDTKEDMVKEAFTAIANTIDAKDTFSGNHSERVAQYSYEIGKRIGYKDLDALYYMALMHDIGNIGIPEDLLKRAGRLLPAEYATMMEHTEIGRKILEPVKGIPNLHYGAKYHHEHFDGSGYNEGLSGEGIPIEGRIIALTDAFDAMTSNRSYRPGLNNNDAILEIQRCSGSQFDPNLVNVLISIIKDGFQVRRHGAE